MQPIRRAFPLLALLALLAGVLPAPVARGAGTFVVTTTADTNDGVCNADCSLREAITAANGAGGGTISFAIAAAPIGGSYWSIGIGATPLPTLTSGGITIDGTTQPGGRASGPKIELRGSSGTNGSGLTISSANNLVRGLIINNFSNSCFFAALGDCGSGITISGAGATGNAVYGSYIGTDANGSAKVANARMGVALISAAANNVIGGVGQGNVISGNGAPGTASPQVLIGSDFFTTPGVNNNVVAGNYIGLAADGRTKLDGTSHGVLVLNNAVGNTIGPGNYIAGNGSGSTRAYGIKFDGKGASGAVQANRVIGNYIGLNIDGAAVANLNGGIEVFWPDDATVSSNNTIGGPNAGDRNYIAGNNENGILLDAPCRTAPAVSTVVQNNAIGLNAAGVAVPNRLSGVRIVDDVVSGSGADVGACRHQIGPDNVISGNDGDGILMRAVSAANPTTLNVVRGNYIGTGLNGTGSVPNGAYGLRLLAGSSANTIGGSTIANTADRNYISGNTNSGILLDSTPSNRVQGNVIVNHVNTNSGGGIEIQNSASTLNQIIGNQIASNRIGILITGSANANTIGTGNDIASNQSYGIQITGAGTNNNQITQNSVHDNGSAGGLDGISIASGTGNHISQTTTTNNGGATGKGINLNAGATAGNGGRAAPTLSLGNNGATLVGSSTCGANCTVEIFTSDANEPNEGNIYLTSFTTDGTGAFSTPLPISGCKPYLVATITDGAGNTSEFSNTVGPVTTCVPAAPGLLLTKDTPDVTNADAGTTYTYNHTLTNNGTAPGTYNVSLSSSQSWATLVPATASYALAAGQSVTIQVRVVVPVGAAAGTSDSSTLTAALVGGGSTAQTDVTTVKQRFDFSFTPPALSNTTPVAPGGSATYNHTITNLGNGPDTFTFGVSNNPPSPAVSVTFAPASCVNIAPGNSCSVVVTVQATDPNNPPPSVVSTITATSKDGVTAHSVVDTTQFKQVAVPVIAPASVSGSGKPGTSVQLVHTLSNAGQIAGTFTVDVPALGNGWVVNVAQPVPNTFAPGATRNFTITVTIPAYSAANPTTYAGYVQPLTVNVPASGENPAAVPASDSVTVLLASNLTFTPTPSTKNGAPNQVVDFTHTIVNTGNGQETFNFAATSPGTGWSVAVIDPTTDQAIASLTLARAASKQVIVRVTVAAAAVPNTSSNTTVTATAQSDASVQASVADTVNVIVAPVPRLDGPQAGSTDPGVALTLNHTVQNVGNAPGSFDISFEGLPTGWTAAASPDPTASLNQNTSPIALTVQITPTADALAGVYRVKVRATARDANAATTSAVDTITVLQKADPRLAPNYNTLGNPGSVVTYTHTLTNAGNFTDTISLSISGTRPWAVNVLPTSVSLAPKATTRVTVTVSVPPGIVAGLTNTATITAASSLPGVVAKATDVTTVARVPGLTLTPPLFVNAGEATKPVTFTYTLFNSGSVTQDYTLTTTLPPGTTGWSATVLSPTLRAVVPGQTVQVRLVVIAPADTPNGTVGDTRLTAQSSGDTTLAGQPSAPKPTATVTARLIVGPAYDVIIAPPRQAGVLPGQVYSYSHTVTNTGLFTDTYLLSTVSLLGWQTSVAPASLTLAPGATAQVVVTVAVPTSAQANVVETTRVYALSATRSTVNPYVDDTSTVLQVAGVQVSPRYSSFVEPGTTVTFLHQVTNLGNGGDSFTLSVTSSLGWPVTLEQTQTPPLGAGVPFPVTLRATVPAGTPKDMMSSIVLRATSNFNGTVFSEGVDTLGSPRTPVNIIIVPDSSYKQYLPLVAR